MNRAQLVQAAKKRARRDARGREDARYQSAMGVFIGAGLLDTNAEITARRGPVELSDVLWAGQLEPRLLELLPAVLIKRPALLRCQELPPDLQSVVHALKKNCLPPDFRGLPGKSLAQWVPRLGHRNKLPTQLKSFRLRPEDIQLLSELAKERGFSETDVVRAGLRALRDATCP